MLQKGFGCVTGCCKCVRWIRTSSAAVCKHQSLLSLKLLRYIFRTQSGVTKIPMHLTRFRYMTKFRVWYAVSVGEISVQCFTTKPRNRTVRIEIYWKIF
jgi:hypothetical protein